MNSRRFLCMIGVAALVVALTACGGGGGDKKGTSYPAAGDDQFEHTTAQVQLELTPDQVSASPVLRQELETIDLEGPALIKRSDPKTGDDDKAYIETEIVSMELTGTASFGAITVRQSVTRPSIGEVRQHEAGEDFPADSFFDVYVEVEIPDLDMTVHNEEPLRMEATLSELPPAEDDVYRGPDGRPLPIYTEAGKKVGQIIDAFHIPEPPPAGTEEPRATGTEPAAQTPTQTASTPASNEVTAKQSLGCKHTQPGVESDLIDLVLLLLFGEPVDGATVEISVEGSGVIDATMTGVTDANGIAEIRPSINRFDSYTTTIESVTLADGTEATLSADSQMTADFTVAQECTEPVAPSP